MADLLWNHLRQSTLSAAAAALLALAFRGNRSPVLEGFYNFEFGFRNEFGRGAVPRADNVAAATPGDEPLFRALQEQLGLKLNPQRATLDVLVVDSVEQPTGNR